MKLIKVKYDILEPVLDFHQAKDSAVLVHPEEDWFPPMEVGGDPGRNLVASEKNGDGDVDAVIADCDEVFEHTYHMRAFNQAMMETFRTYCESYPANAVLLVDTYNTLKSGIPNAIRAFNDVLKPLGIKKCGIRLDSGDIAYLSRKARKMLDEAGWESCTITVSNSLDEYLIQDLWMQDAKIDAFGVGERLITAKSEPVFGCVYKLVAVEDKDGNIVPKIKISENVGKITTPHFKKLYRFYGRDTGKAIADYLTVYDESVDDSRNLEIFDPDATWKRKEVYHFEARELLVPIYQKGKLVYKRPGIEEIKKYCAEQVDTLWDEVKRFDNPHTYYVDLSQKLWDIKDRLLHEGGRLDR